jgi:hypothetical protein
MEIGGGQKYEKSQEIYRTLKRAHTVGNRRGHALGAVGSGVPAIASVSTSKVGSDDARPANIKGLNPPEAPAADATRRASWRGPAAGLHLGQGPGTTTRTW